MFLICRDYLLTSSEYTSHIFQRCKVYKDIIYSGTDLRRFSLRLPLTEHEYIGIDSRFTYTRPRLRTNALGRIYGQPKQHKLHLYLQEYYSLYDPLTLLPRPSESEVTCNSTFERISRAEELSVMEECCEGLLAAG